jgi:3-hydroxybutyryl-CoA dehydrogenase
MEIKRVGICGCGLMGSGIAEVASKAGLNVVVREVNDELLKKGLARIEKSLSKAVEKGKLDESAKKEILGRISGTTDFADLKDCDLVSEAIIENIDEKLKL